MKYQDLLCNNIKSLRIKFNLTQEKFAEMTGVTADTIRNIEHCKYTPTAKTIDKICASFKISPFDLLILEPTFEQLSITNTIIQKLKTCDIIQLDKINSIIDIIKK